MIWIKGFEDRYKITDRGEIFSFVRGLPVLLTCNSQGRGKRIVKLFDSNGKKKWFQLHRLVAAAYLPQPIRGQRYIQFKDRNTLNVSASNLEWVLRPEVYSREDIEPTTFYPKGKVLNIRRAYYEGEEVRTLARRFGVRQETIKAIVNQRLK